MYSTLAVKARDPDSGKVSSTAIAKPLFDVVHALRTLQTEKPEFSNDHDSQYLKVFADVISAVASLFKNDDVQAQKLEQLLLPLSSYTSLFQYFLLIKSILNNMKSIIEVDFEEHKAKLEWVNMELTRIAVVVTSLAKNLEDLGNSFIDIVKGEDSRRAANLIVFDIHCHRVSFSLTSCISDMELVKSEIDKGLGSIRAFKKKTMAIMVCGGVFAVAAAIIAPVGVIYLGAIAAYGTCLLIGAGVLGAHYVGGMGPCSLWNDYKSACKIEKCYKSQECNWLQLDEKLKTMKAKLECDRKIRSQLNT